MQWRCIPSPDGPHGVTERELISSPLRQQYRTVGFSYSLLLDHMGLTSGTAALPGCWRWRRYLEPCFEVDARAREQTGLILGVARGGNLDIRCPVEITHGTLSSEGC